MSPSICLLLFFLSNVFFTLLHLHTRASHTHIPAIPPSSHKDTHTHTSFRTHMHPTPLIPHLSHTHFPQFPYTGIDVSLAQDDAAGGFGNDLFSPGSLFNALLEAGVHSPRGISMNTNISAFLTFMTIDEVSQYSSVTKITNSMGFN